MPRARRLTGSTLRVLLATACTAVSLSVPSAGAEGTANAGGLSLSYVRYSARDAGSIYSFSLDRGDSALLVRAHHADPYDLDYYDPAWTRDGRRFAATETYTSDGQGNGERVALLKPKPRIDINAGNDAGSPSWAPDGRSLVFVEYAYFDPQRGGALNIWRPNMRVRELTPNASYYATENIDDTPAWSPNGLWIAFARSAPARKPPRLYLIRPDGKRTKRLTNNLGRNPTWSPDSRRIAFDDSERIAVVRIDGTHLRYLANGADPDWSPDGRLIAFVRGRDIWLMAADGTQPRRIIMNGSEPAWRQVR